MASAVGGVQAAIAEFVSYVFEPDDIVEIRRVPSKWSSWHKASELSQQAAALARDNERGQNVYVGINPRKQRGARDGSGVALARCLFADLDRTTVTAASVRWRRVGLPKPGLVVNSGHGVHVYWRLAEPLIDLATWGHTQRRLIEALGSDCTVKDAARILRLPGLLNVKDPAKPAPCRVLACRPGRSFALADLVKRLPEVPEQPVADSPAVTVEPADLRTVEQARAYLANVPPAVQGQGGDDHTYRAACKVARDFGLAAEQVMPLLREWNERCDPPWTEKELREKCRNAWRYGKGDVGCKRTVQPPEERGGSSGGPRVSLREPPADRYQRPPSTAMVRRVADVRREHIAWLWPHRIALGKLTLIVGDPELGKSLITMDLAAHVTRGLPWPDGTPCLPGGALILSAEDDPGDTIRPRLGAAGADLSYVALLDTVREVDTGNERQFSLVSDVAALHEAAQSLSDCRLVVIDPISAYMGRVDSHSNTMVRGILSPLARVASQLRVAIVCVSHLRKSEGSIVYRVMDSIAFTAAPRSAWLVTKDRQDPTGARRLFLPIKGNLTANRQGSAYRIQSRDGQPYIDWEARPVVHCPDEHDRR